MKKKLIIVLLFIILAAVIGYNYIYQDHRTIENETAEFLITSTAIESQFSRNMEIAEAKYLNKTVEISGTVSEVNTNNITLNDKVFCQFSEALEVSISNHLNIKIKGRVIGYDDLLEQVKLDQCTIINN